MFSSGPKRSHTSHHHNPPLLNGEGSFPVSLLYSAQILSFLCAAKPVFSCAFAGVIKHLFLFFLLHIPCSLRFFRISPRKVHCSHLNTSDCNLLCPQDHKMMPTSVLSTISNTFSKQPLSLVSPKPSCTRPFLVSVVRTTGSIRSCNFKQLFHSTYSIPTRPQQWSLPQHCGHP